MLFGEQALNSGVAVGPILLAAGLLARHLPARRVASIEPMRVLRME